MTNERIMHPSTFHTASQLASELTASQPRCIPSLPQHTDTYPSICCICWGKIPAKTTMQLTEGPKVCYNVCPLVRPTDRPSVRPPGPIKQHFLLAVIYAQRFKVKSGTFASVASCVGCCKWTPGNSDTKAEHEKLEHSITTRTLLYITSE